MAWRRREKVSEKCVGEMWVGERKNICSAKRTEAEVQDRSCCFFLLHIGFLLHYMFFFATRCYHMDDEVDSGMFCTVEEADLISSQVLMINLVYSYLYKTGVIFKGFCFKCTLLYYYSNLHVLNLLHCRNVLKNLLYKCELFRVTVTNNQLQLKHSHFMS